MTFKKLERNTSIQSRIVSMYCSVEVILYYDKHWKCIVLILLNWISHDRSLFPRDSKWLNKLWIDKLLFRKSRFKSFKNNVLSTNWLKICIMYFASTIDLGTRICDIILLYSKTLKKQNSTEIIFFLQESSSKNNSPSIDYAPISKFWIISNLDIRKKFLDTICIVYLVHGKIDAIRLLYFTSYFMYQGIDSEIIQFSKNQLFI